MRREHHFTTPEGKHMLLVHSTACDAACEALREWRARWPNACASCSASGQWYDAGDRWTPPDGGPCAVCVEAGTCPRCGNAAWPVDRPLGDFENAFEDEPSTWPSCPHCGYAHGAEPDDREPVADCFCWEEQGAPW
jgi:hypothetical protein